MVFNILMFIVFGAVLAFSVRDGIWTNTVRYVNVLIAALIATNYYEVLADTLESAMPSFTYFVDYLSIWLIFVLAYILLRVVTDSASKCRVRFPGVIDRYVGMGISLVMALTFVSFTMFAMHTAPLQKNYWGISSQPATFGGAWGTFASVTSNGSLSSGSATVDPQRHYSNYLKRRDNLGMYISDKQTLRIGPSDERDHQR